MFFSYYMALAATQADCHCLPDCEKVNLYDTTCTSVMQYFMQFSYKPTTEVVTQLQEEDHCLKIFDRSSSSSSDATNVIERKDRNLFEYAAQDSFQDPQRLIEYARQVIKVNIVIKS